MESVTMKSKYKNVYRPTPRQIGRTREWRARITVDGHRYDQYYETELEAAKAIDKILIRHNKPPRLVKKKQ